MCRGALVSNIGLVSTRSSTYLPRECISWLALVNVFRKHLVMHLFKLFFDSDSKRKDAY